MILGIVAVIGIVVGLAFDKVAGPGWLTRQIAGENRMMLTSALVGIAGAFIGFHLTITIGLGAGVGALIGAVLGAAAVLWLWRVVK